MPRGWDHQRGRRQEPGSAVDEAVTVEVELCSATSWGRCSEQAWIIGLRLGAAVADRGRRVPPGPAERAPSTWRLASAGSSSRTLIRWFAPHGCRQPVSEWGQVSPLGRHRPGWGPSRRRVSTRRPWAIEPLVKNVPPPVGEEDRPLVGWRASSTDPLGRRRVLLRLELPTRTNPERKKRDDLRR